MEISKNCFSALSLKIGQYAGRGVNHENQGFNGTMKLSEILNGRGILLEFKACGDNGTVFHEEHSLLSFDETNTLAMWNLNTNLPFLAKHKLIRKATFEDAEQSFVFGYNDTTDRNEFREEIAIDLYFDGSLGYRHSWGMPHQDFAARSGLKMRPHFG